MDEALIKKAIAGDREALEKLIKSHHEPLSAALGGQVPPQWQSVLGLNDVLQETYSMRS